MSTSEPGGDALHVNTVIIPDTSYDPNQSEGLGHHVTYRACLRLHCNSNVVIFAYYEQKVLLISS